MKCLFTSAFMNKTSKLNDILYLIIVVVHLYNRQWPWGDILQTVLDVVFAVTGILIAAKYVLLAKKK